MPYLNWKEQARLKQEISDSGGGKLGMKLSIETGRLTELHALLAEALVPGGGELRVDLPRGWIVFWKIRDGESRLLLAHPQEDEWVATVALSSEHAARLLERMKGAGPGLEIVLGELAATGSVSNLELILVALDPAEAAGPPGR